MSYKEHVTNKLNKLIKDDHIQLLVSTRIPGSHMSEIAFLNAVHHDHVEHFHGMFWLSNAVWEYVPHEGETLLEYTLQTSQPDDTKLIFRLGYPVTDKVKALLFMSGKSSCIAWAGKAKYTNIFSLRRLTGFVPVELPNLKETDLETGMRYYVAEDLYGKFNEARKLIAEWVSLNKERAT